ncbi:MAG: 3',5'-cyclic-nucleotide phosphodiesterase [Woeseia sp.]|nr:3',5'-cyclic-nucleotide phosphodiesterase [Woeseia sp.]MBT8097637.1 3',5'-cyclic-nucleotide phosphodiesterase [Woeseia sp.]NNE60547.1 3',5'-cyclic-nucleotide phosphodiesterase [Woeseia sp.]NNL55683.1 3',5'-cyclic-nucleotide phosphodiesterase [Woeseia sp.]
MQIRILGCSGGIGGSTRTSAMLLDDDLLIDAGTGIGDLSLAELRNIRHVFLTHAHLDHIAGLPMLVDAVFDVELDKPLTVYARPETIQALRDHIFNGVIWPDFATLPNATNPVLRYHECRPGDAIEVGQRKFSAVDVSHTVPALGYTVHNSQGAFAVSGDTRTNETLWPALNACADLRVLVIEVSFPDEDRELADVSGHYCPATLVNDLAKLKHEPDIWLTGMKPGEEDIIFRQVLAGLPGRRINMLSRGAMISL